MAGIGNATKYGILISKGDALERLAKVTQIAFDKTGTLTLGKPAVLHIRVCKSFICESELFDIIASAEVRSEHPLGKAIVTHYKQEIKKIPTQPEEFKLIAGRGVFAIVNGQTVYAGNETILTERELSLSEKFQVEITEARNSGCTIIYIMSTYEILGFIVLSDTLRLDAAEMVKSIQRVGVKTVLLTGDSPQAAKHITGMAGITYVQASCLPKDKLLAIRKYQKQGEPVCMVRDGINDAPALKAEQVGIAMGGVGSDIAIEAANIALVGDDIKEIPHLLLLSRRVMRTINFNLAAAMFLNFAAIILAITGILNPILGALVHNAGSVAVIINSSLLLKWRNKK
jgi:P-type E1-E2 ATPase